MGKDDQFARHATLSFFAVVVPSNRERESVCIQEQWNEEIPDVGKGNARFVIQLSNCSRRLSALIILMPLSLVMKAASSSRMEDSIRVRKRGTTVETRFTCAIEKDDRTSKPRPQMTLCIFESNSSQDLMTYEARGVELGIQTQSAVFKTFQSSTPFSFVSSMRFFFC